MAALRARWIALCVAVLLGHLPARDAHAREDDQVAILTVRINEEERGEIPVLLRSGDVLIPVSKLRELWLESVAARGRREGHQGQEYVSVSSLAPSVSFRTDEQELRLDLHADPSVLPETQINLGMTAPPGIEYRSDTSVFLNYAPRLLDFQRLDGYAEAGLSTGKMLLWSAASYAEERGLVRGPSHLIFDDHKSMRRVTVGDSFSSGGALGGGFHAGGVSVSRNFDLDPYFIRGPTLGASTMALTPSQLDVYVNGVRVRQQQVAPGPVTIQNLQGQSGAGVVRYVLRDVFGREQALASPFYLSNGVLRAGVEEYTYTVGVKRENLGLASFDYAAPVALGRHRVGLTDRSTVGGRLELGAGAASGGGTWTWLTPHGLLDLALGLSHGGGAGGAAGAASYSFQSPRGGLGVSAQTMSGRYATTSLRAEEDRPLLQFGAFSSLSLGSRATAGVQHSLSYLRDAGPTVQSSLTSTYLLASGITLLGTFSRLRSPREPSRLEGMITLSFNIDRTSAQIAARVRSDGADEALATLSHSSQRLLGHDLRAMAVHSDGAVQRAQAHGEYRGQHGVYALTYAMDRQGSRRQQTVILSTRGSIVWIPGVGVFASRPVGQALGVLRLPGARGVRGYLNNQEIGRTDRDGDLLIPDLLPYYANRLSFADNDLPLSFQIEGTERQLAPPFRGAAVAQFRVKRTLFHRATVRVEGPDGALSVPSYGDLQVSAPDQVVASPIGKLGEIELEGLPPGTYPAEILHERGGCSFALRIPEGAGPVVEMGEVRCKKP
ncbi:MAG: fimbria/pilus outer membrane usher protein [Polyangiaceae bacterium]|jgi:outer membrane usher protein|nr:fimbria/pilus outer membrane usher protein [Polyangiaceae bacterium]